MDSFGCGTMSRPTVEYDAMEAASNVRRHARLFFVKKRKEQDVERVFNDCAVMAICGNVTERVDLNDQSLIGLRGVRTKGIAL